MGRQMHEVAGEINSQRDQLYSKKPYQNDGYVTTLLVCAEECSELAKECLKMARYYTDDKSLRDGFGEINERLNEEVGDVILGLCNLFDAGVVDDSEVIYDAIVKIRRYEKLMNQKGG